MEDWGNSYIDFLFAKRDGITLENKSIEIDWLNQVTVSYLKYEKWSKGQVSTNRIATLCAALVWNRRVYTSLESIGFSNITRSTEYVYEKEPSNANQTITFEAVRKE